MKPSDGHGHNMGKGAKIKTYRDYRGSGLADPLPKRSGKFAHIDGQLDLFDMGAIEMPGDADDEQEGDG